MPWRNKVGAILLGWFGGQEFGAAIADILLGREEPGGRLPTSWPDALDDVPVRNTAPVNGAVEYTEGIHVGYRAWLKQQAAGGPGPAYPFGFGMGYTTFTLGAGEVPDSVTAGAPVTISVPVLNTGKRTGREVVQVYLSRPDSAIERPLRWLAGFGEILLTPGERATLTISLEARAFQHYDGGWQQETGSFTVLMGRHAEDDFQSHSITVR
jgi:beta-glucosidase